MTHSPYTLQRPRCEEREKYTEDDYDDMLRECCSTHGDGYVHIGNLSYDVAQVLKQIDPTAYRCGFNDYQEYEDAYICPICDEEYADEDDALWCCQFEPECACDHGSLNDDHTFAHENDCENDWKLWNFIDGVWEKA